MKEIIYSVCLLAYIELSQALRVKIKDFKDGFVCQDYVDILENPNVRSDEGFEEPKIIVSEITAEDWDDLKKECQRAYKDVEKYKCVSAGFDSEKKEGGCVAYLNPTNKELKPWFLENKGSEDEWKTLMPETYSYASALVAIYNQTSIQISLVAVFSMVYFS